MNCRTTAAALRSSFCLLAFFALTASGSLRADVINLDLSNVDPSAISVMLEAEAVWEARIQFYSSEVPKAILNQLSALTITATVAPIDGVDGTLAFAGPDATVTIGNSSRNYSVAVRSSMTIDLDDFPSMLADGILLDTIVHEMGHAMGFGTLFAGNDLIGPLNGFGLTQYIGGKYAITGYRTGISNPFASFVPLEQGGGDETALGHWADVEPFFNQTFLPAATKELMTGFACDVVPGSDPEESICPPTFISEATWGALADLGFAVSGINGGFAAPKGFGTGRWPKITGPTTDPFDANGIMEEAPRLSFRLASLKLAYRHSSSSEGSGVGDVQTEEKQDPFNLRHHRWVR